MVDGPLVHRLLASLSFALLVPSVAAAAPDVAPGLSLASLHQEASDALARVVAQRPSLPAGTYVAVDPDPVHPYVIPACDDDGDAVVVVSDAALKLLEHASYGQALDEARGTRSVAAYGALLASAQRPEARLLPPGGAFFRDVDAVVERAATTHFRAGLGFWIGRAASVHDASEFRCARPDSFREHGDRTWTVAERSVALARAAALGSERDGLRTAWALAGVFALGGDERSAVAVTTLAQSHPWRGPFPLPTADVVRATAVVVRDAARARAAAEPEAAPAPPAKPVRETPLARLRRRYP